MTGHGFRHASHQEPAQTLPSMGTKDNQLSVPNRCIVNDPGLRVTLFHDFTCFKAHFSQVSSCALDECFGFFSPFPFHLCDVGNKARNHVNRDITADWFDYMQHSNLRSFCPELFGNCLHGDL